LLNEDNLQSDKDDRG
jgi:hypothetical protein